MSDTDVIIVELPKNKEDYVFSPPRVDGEEEKHDEFLDPLSNVTVNSTNINAIAKLDLKKLYKKNSRQGITGL